MPRFQKGREALNPVDEGTIFGEVRDRIVAALHCRTRISSKLASVPFMDSSKVRIELASPLPPLGCSIRSVLTQGGAELENSDRRVGQLESLGQDERV